MYKTRFSLVFALAALFAFQTGTLAASPNETARLLAGMKLPASSKLHELTRTRSWQQHARAFNTAWAGLTGRQINPIRTWARTHLKAPRPVMYYMFSGPDFLYANAFYPKARTYILSGLEPVGRVPDAGRLRRYTLSGALWHLRSSLQTVLNYSFFITKDMKDKLRGGEFGGTLPLLYVFLARAGKSIQKTEFVRLNRDGSLSPAGAPRAKGKKRRRIVPGVRVTFSGGNGPQTLYYFQTDLSDSGVKQSGFLKFAGKFGLGDSLVKSASYLMHRRHFGRVRDFLLDKSAHLVQDDSGIPVRHFKTGAWDLKPFGRYFRPIPIFEGYYQPAMSRLFRRGRTQKPTFGIGYRWRKHETNVLLAIKRNPKTAGDR